MNRYNFKVLEKLKLHPFVEKFKTITTVIVVLLIGILFLPWQQTVKGTGQVIAYNPTEREYFIQAPISGFIKQFYVSEDQFVKKGQKLFSMTDLDKKYLENLKQIKENIQKQKETTKEEINVLKEKLENLYKSKEAGLNIYQRKINQTKDKIQSLNLKIVSLTKNYQITKSNYQRIKQLYESGLSSKRDLELAENKYTKAKVDLEKAKLDLKIEKENLHIIQKEQEKFLNDINNKINTVQKQILTAENKISSYNKELQKINIQLGRYKTSTVLAEKDGYVVRILKNDKNQYIKQGEKIILFAPKTQKRAILLKVSAFDMPLIKKGLPARIQFYGWPTLHISGWPIIRYGTFGGIIDKVDPIAYEKGFYYAYIVEDPQEPWPSPEVLKSGTQATVWIRLSTVPIWYEIWRKINAFPPKMVNPDREKK